MDEPRLGFSHHHTLEELRDYRALTAEQKLAWLHSAWRLTADFLPRGKVGIYQAMRGGRERRGEREVAEAALRASVAPLATLSGVEILLNQPPKNLATRLTRRLPDGSSRTIRIIFTNIEDPGPCYAVLYSAYGNADRAKNGDARRYGTLEFASALAKAWIADLAEWDELPRPPATSTA